MATTAYLSFDRQSRQMRLIAGESVLLSRHIPEPKKISPSKLDLRQMSRVRSEIVRFAKVRSITIEGGEK